MCLEDKLNKHKGIDLETQKTKKYPIDEKTAKRFMWVSFAFVGLIIFIKVINPKADACDCSGVMSMWETKGVIAKSKTELLNDCNDSYRNSNSAYTKCLEEVEDSRR